MTDSIQGIGCHRNSSDSPFTRLVFIDNLRVFLTMLVVAHHAAQPYGPTGGRWLIFNSERAEILGAFFSTNAAFFMGLFFLISGYFLPEAYNRKGAVLFLKERSLRLGVPILLFALLAFPLMLYAFSDRQLSVSQYFVQTYLNLNQLELGHLWFLAHLFVYAISYCIWRTWFSHRVCSFNSLQVRLSPPTGRTIGVYLVGLAIATFVVRIQYPIDTWVRVCGLIPVEVAHLPQYLSLWMIGVIAWHHNWLNRISSRQGLKWLGVGLGAVLLRYLYSLGGHRLFPPSMIAGGGWNWSSALWSTWEAVICVGLCVGLLILFRDYIKASGRWQKFLATNAYAVYLIHLPIVVGVQLSFVGVAIDPLTKFLAVTLVSLPICWGGSYFLRKLPFMSKIL